MNIYSSVSSIVSHGSDSFERTVRLEKDFLCNYFVDVLFVYAVACFLLFLPLQDHEDLIFVVMKFLTRNNSDMVRAYQCLTRLYAQGSRTFGSHVQTSPALAPCPLSMLMSAAMLQDEFWEKYQNEPSSWNMRI